MFGMGKRGPKPADVQERFWEKVDFSPEPDGCWLWLRSTSNGYGYFPINVDGRWTSRSAHRLAWEFLRGEIPAGMTLDHRHTCPKHCLNPDHLRLCTQKQNNENRSGAYKTSTTGVRGVFWFKRTGKWIGSVRHNGKQHHVGYFTTLEEAEEAVRLKRLELFTHSDMDLMT